MIHKSLTEHMLGYFDPADWVNCFTKHAGLFYLSHLLFKNDYKMDWKLKNKTHTIARGNSNNKNMNIYY